MTNDVAWAPGAGPYGAPAGWPPPARPGPDPAALLRAAAGGLAVVAGALTVGGSFPAMMVTRTENFNGDTSTTSFSGWGNASESRGDGPGRELLLGIRSRWSPRPWWWRGRSCCCRHAGPPGGRER